MVMVLLFHQTLNLLLLQDLIAMLLFGIRCLVNMYKYSHPTRCFTQVHFSHDGSRLASAGEDGLMCVWQVESGTLIVRLEGHLNSVNGVCFHPTKIDDTIYHSI